MTVFRFEFTQALKSTFGWFVGLAATVVLFMAFFPVYADQVEVMRPLMESLPELVLKGLGVNLDILFTAMGFYAFILLYIQLIAAMQGMILGVGIVGKETRLKMADFILTKPISRGSVLIQKSAAILAHLLITWILFTGLSYIAISQVSDLPLDKTIFGLFSLSNLMIMVVFAALGILIASWLRHLKSVIGVSLSVVFALFILNLMQAILEEPWIRYLCPFQWFDKGYIFFNKAFEWNLVGMWALVTLGSLILAYLVYTRKDIHAV